jgi:carboxyl-terminal processing protease
MTRFLKRRSSIFLSVLAITMVSLVVSCDKFAPDVKAPPTYSDATYSDVFEAFWNGMNTNYVFWDIDPTNWDQEYATYKPLFATLTSFNSANDATAEKYFTQMTANLVDSHYTLTFQKSGNQVSPALNRKLAIDKLYPDSIYQLPATFFKNVVASKYIDPSSLIMGTDSIANAGSKIAFTVITGTIHNSILYLYFSSFSFSQAVHTAPALNSFFNTLANLPAGIKGIVIDVRSNGGGDTVDLDELIGKMIRSPVTYGYSHAKSGIGRLDFSPAAPAIVSPQSGAVALTIPIIIIADHLSISMAEITALAVKSLPNGTFIGTTTWGANGPLLPNAYLNGGQFSVGSTNFGISVYTSSAALKSTDGQSYEGRGVPPDIWVPETGAAYSQNDDLQLDKAIDYINTHP